MKVINNATFSMTGAQSDEVSAAKNGTDEQRKVLSITNLEAAGGTTAYFSVGQEGAANTGIPCAPGQTITWSSTGNYNPPNLAIHGYAGGAITIAVYEEIEVY
jgi:hypothetical protein